VVKFVLSLDDCIQGFNVRLCVRAHVCIRMCVDSDRRVAMVLMVCGTDANSISAYVCAFVHVCIVLSMCVLCACSIVKLVNAVRR
jgi:hypothetical protein